MPELYLEAIIILDIHCKQLSRISGLVSNSKLLSVVHKLSKAIKFSACNTLSWNLLFNAVLINFRPFYKNMNINNNIDHNNFLLLNSYL